MKSLRFTTLLTTLAFWLASNSVFAIDNGTAYYIRYYDESAEEYYYLSGGANWGVRAVTANHGTTFTTKASGSNTATVDGGTYQIYFLETEFASGNGSGNNVYWGGGDQLSLNKGTDNNARFVFVPTQGGKYFLYNVQNNSHYVNGAPAVYGGEPITYAASGTAWELVTKDQLADGLSVATKTNPVDATFFISDPNLAANARAELKAMWKVNGGYSSLKMGSEVNASSIAKTKIKSEAYDNVDNGKKANVRVTEAAAGNDPWTVSQTLTGLPAGNYLLKVQGVSSRADRAYLYVKTSRGDVYVDDEAFVANSAKIYDANRYTDAYELFSTDDGTYTRTMQVSVYEDGTLTIGVKGDGNPAAAAYTYFDNFELYCLDCSKQDFQPNISSYWEEVTSVHDAFLHPENYFFSIWSDENSCFVMRNGEDGDYGQGAEFKTMSQLQGLDPIDSLSYMWELYAFTIEGGLYNYVLISPTEREHMLQEETGTGYFRFKADGTTAIDESLAALQLTNPVGNTWAWNFTTKSGKRLSSWYYDVWANTSNDASHARLKLYAIPRSYYVSDMPQALYNASELTPYDFSLMLGNPDAAGTDGSYRIGSQNNRIGWVSSNATVKTITDDGLNGVSLFEYASEGSGSFLQTIYNLPKGRYELSVSCKNAPSNAYLYISNGTTEWTAPLNDAKTKSVIGELTDDDIELIVGIKSDGAVSTPFQFDNFKLTYWGVGNGSDVGLADGIDYYVRYNAGTDEDPVYYYLTAGGNYGTEAVTGLHATPYRFVSAGETFWLQGVTAHANGTDLTMSYLGYTDGSYFNDYSNLSDFKFVPRDVNNLSRGYRIMDNSTGDYIIHHGLDKAITGHESELSIWQIVSKAQLFLEMSDASPYVPVDATFLLDDQGFSRNNRMKSSWKVKYNGAEIPLTYTKIALSGNDYILNDGAASGNPCDHNIKFYCPSNNVQYYVQQTLTGIPNGFYRVSGLAFASGANKAQLFANNGSEEVTVGYPATEKLNNVKLGDVTNANAYTYGFANPDNYKKSVVIEVVDGTLTLGFKIANNVTAFFDNIELYYLGTQDPSAEFCTQPVNFELAGASSDWIEVTESTADIWANPENYLFSIWQSPTQCYGWADGTDGKQGASYKTMSVVECSEPMASAATLWEFYKEDDKYVIVPAADREHMLQTEGSANIFRYATNTSLSTDLAAVTFVPADYDNWLISTKQGYLHKWDAAADVVVNSDKGYLKVYAIRRSDYVVKYCDVANVASLTNPIDVSLLMANPSAVGNSEIKAGVMGWTSSAAANIWTVDEGTASTLPTIEGKSYFTMSKSGNNTFSQTLTGLCAGQYEFSVGTQSDIADGAELFVTVGSETYVASMNYILYHDHTDHVTLHFTLTEDTNDITVGLRTSGYAGSSNLLFDDFRLIYKGTGKFGSSEVASGEEYYIAYNAGTEQAPDYHFVNFGASWGVEAITAKHGEPFKIEASGDYWRFYCPIIDSNARYLGYKTRTDADAPYSGYYTSSNVDSTLFAFEPVDADDVTKGYYIKGYIPGNSADPRNAYLSPNANGDGYPIVRYSGGDDKTAWYLFTANQMLDRFALASWASPVDASFLIYNGRFNRQQQPLGTNAAKQPGNWSLYCAGAATEWQWVTCNATSSVDNVSVTYNNSNDKTNYAKSNNNLRIVYGEASSIETVKVQLTIPSLPNGLYRLRAKGVANVADSYYLFARDSIANEELSSTAFEAVTSLTSSTANDAAATGYLASSRAENYAKSIEFVVTNNVITVGVRSSVKGTVAFIDDFELYYLGSGNDNNLDPVEFAPYNNGINGNWIEVTSASDDALLHPEDYLFSVWESTSSCMGMDKGTSGYQETGYNTMSYVLDCGDPILNDSLLWEFYKMSDGSYVIVPAADREHTLQTESGDASKFRYATSVANVVTRAEVNFVEAGLYNNWLIQVNSTGKYVHKSSGAKDVVADDTKSYFKIYAISRSSYGAYHNPMMKYTASIVNPEDITLMMRNPQALSGTTSATGVPVGWTQSVASKVTTANGTASDFASIDGLRYFNFAKGTYTFSQKIDCLEPGLYKVCVLAGSAPANALLYVKMGDRTTSVALNEVDAHNCVTLEFSVPSGTSDIEVGVNCNGVTQTFNLDGFHLLFASADESESLDIVAGLEYYLRVNVGTSSNPDYRYLAEGQNSARQAVTREHGLPFWFVALDSTSHLSGFEGLQTYKIQTAIGANNSGNDLRLVRYLGRDGDQNFKLDKPDEVAKRNEFVFVPVADKPNNFYIYATDLGKYIVPAYFTMTVGNYEGETHRLEVSDTPVAWEIVTKTTIVNEMNMANSFSGRDATVFIADNEIYSRYRGDLCKWNITCGGATKPMDIIANDIKLPSDADIKVIVKRNYAGGDNKWSFVHVSQANAEYKIWQTLTGLPAGTYELAVRAMSSQENASYLYADNGSEVKQSVITQSSHATEVNQDLDKRYFYEYNYSSVNTADFKTTVRFKVGDDGTATIGIKGGTVSGDVTNFDRFELTYLGSIEVLDSYNDNPVKFEPNASDSWIEVVSLDDDPMQNPDDYLFSIWRSPVEVAGLAAGSSDIQGADYMTMSAVSTTEPMNSLSTLWEFYKNGSTYMLVSAAKREQALQTETGDTRYFRYASDASTATDYAKAGVTFAMGNYNNWTIRTSGSKYLHRSDVSHNDYVADDARGYFKIYAIPRVTYYKEAQNVVYKASIMTPVDLPLMIVNAEGFGKLDNAPLSWGSSGTGIHVKKNTDADFAGKNGDFWFEYNSNTKPTAKTGVMTQTLKNMMKGYYLFELTTNISTSGATIRIKAGEKEMTEDLKNSDLQSHTVAVPIELAEDGDITIGVDLSGCAVTINEETGEASDTKYVIRFDKLNLKFLGTSETLTEAIGEGEYFIRANMGTDEKPDYYYLNAGGYKWGTDPVLDRHGYRFDLAEVSDVSILSGAGVWNDGNTYYSMHTELNQYDASHGPFFDGAQLDHALDYSVMRFEPVHPDANSLEYYIYAARPKDGITKGYVSPNEDRMSMTSASDKANAQIWEVVSTGQRIKELQDATVRTPMDATFFIKNPSFSRNNTGLENWLVGNNNTPLPFLASVDGIGNSGSCFIGTDGELVPYSIIVGENPCTSEYYFTNDLGKPVYNPDSESKTRGIKIEFGTNGGNATKYAGDGNVYNYNVKLTGQQATATPYDIHQTVKLENLPAGHYRLSASGYASAADLAELYVATADGTDYGSASFDAVSGKSKQNDQKMAGYLFTMTEEAQFMASRQLQLYKDASTKTCYSGSTTTSLNDKEETVYTYSYVAGADPATALAEAKGYRTDRYQKHVDFDFSGTGMRIGIRGELKNGQYVIFDNFELYYMGESYPDAVTINDEEGDAYYLYNIDAGKFLSKEVKADGTAGNNVFISQYGDRFYFEKVAGKENTFHIYSYAASDKNKETPLYLGPTTASSSHRVAVLYNTNTTPHEWTFTRLGTDEDGNNIYTVTDSVTSGGKTYPRVLEWSGDSYGLVFAGLENDLEPRGTRWVFYPDSHYDRNRMFITLAQETRSELWPVMRSARVNLRKEGRYAIDNLQTTYNELDALWASTMASNTALRSKGDGLKQLMIDAMKTKGSVHSPIDVTFYMKESGLGLSVADWSGNDYVLQKVGTQSWNTNVDRGIVSMAGFYLFTTGGKKTYQVVSGLPAGRYSVSVDAKKYSSGTNAFKLALESNGNEAFFEDKCSTIMDSYKTGTLQLESGNDLKVSIETMAGTAGLAFDNFSLLYCGSVDGKMSWNSDSTEMTLVGDWDDEEDLLNAVYDSVKSKEHILGTIFINKDDAYFSDNDKVKVNGENWTDGNNVLVYTDYDNSIIEGDTNIVRMTDAGNSCEKFVLTDKMPLHVPDVFTAEKATYERATTLYDGWAWGSIVMPFALSKLPENVSKFYDVVELNLKDYVYGNLSIQERPDGTLGPNTPVLYAACGNLKIDEDNVEVRPTSELASPDPENDDLSLYGSYVKKYYVGDPVKYAANAGYYSSSAAAAEEASMLKNAHGLCARDCYYLKQNKFYRGNGYFSITPFKAFIYRGAEKFYENDEVIEADAAAARPSMLEIVVFEYYNAADMIEAEQNEITGIYDAQGIRHSGVQHGVNVIRYKDGSSKSIFVK